MRFSTGILLLCGTMCPSGEAFAQRLGQGSGGDDIALVRVVLALALCLTLAVAGAFALRWKTQRGPGVPFVAQRRMQLVERLRLSNQVDLCLVRCDGREFMIATSPRDTNFGPDFIQTRNEISNETGAFGANRDAASSSLAE